MDTQTNSMSDLPRLHDSVAESGVEECAGESGFDLESMLSDPAVKQIVVRSENEGIDQLVGYYRCEFAPDEKRNILHVPIQPPMMEQPKVQAIGVEDDIRVRVTDCQKFGVRLEILLNQATAENHGVVVEIILTSSTLSLIHI